MIGTAQDVQQEGSSHRMRQLHLWLHIPLESPAEEVQELWQSQLPLQGLPELGFQVGSNSCLFVPPFLLLYQIMNDVYEVFLVTVSF